MKKIHIILWLLFAPFILFSQSLPREVIAADGDFLKNSTGSMSFTLGEAVITTFESSTIHLTQGFQQNDLIRYMIYGKVRYLGKALAGNPAPTPATYNPAIYNISKVIVILKNQGNGMEVARDTTTTQGVFHLDNISDGEYIISYDKYTADTMQMVNDINAIDVAIVKYLAGHDTVYDPSRSFTSKHKKAANVDNNTLINAVDIARLKSKIGQPYLASGNFPRGNWVAFDTAVSVNGSNLNLTLKTVGYGDYDASSTRYKDSAANWDMSKALSEEILITSNEYIQVSEPSYFEIPFISSTVIKDFSALGLEMEYPRGDFKLVSARMQGEGVKGLNVKINPTLEEIIADDNDLLVTDYQGVIRVVYATTDFYDILANAPVMILGFEPRRVVPAGVYEFFLKGTGVIGDQYGNALTDTYLMVPKLSIQNTSDIAPSLEFSGYPNPFHRETSISFYLPEDGTARLKVFNSIGEEVAVLVNGSIQRGRHTVIFSPETLAVGMYTFKLEFTGAKTTAQSYLKMINN